VINGDDIYNGKMREDHGISYDKDLIRLLAVFQSSDLYVGSVVVSRYEAKPKVDQFIANIESLGTKVYKHYRIEDYPRAINHILSEDGYGKNDYIETTRPLIVVTSPGPGSGKIAVCLSQLYHDSLRKIRAGYAKFELFPIWNLSIDHPVNMAYEASTADLDDEVLIDYFHKESYGDEVVNYNRDMDVYPILNLLLSMNLGENPYRSPTDMGVNVAGACIDDEMIIAEASYREILRRYELSEEGSIERQRLSEIRERIPKGS
jgi:uncharacterized protein (UPF0371 family)